VEIQICQLILKILNKAVLKNQISNFLKFLEAAHAQKQSSAL
jgi:hypothetical protein